MTRIQAFIVSSIFLICSSLISASFIVTSGASRETSSSAVLGGFDSLSDAISGTYSRSEEVRPKRVDVANKSAKKKRTCDPAQQTCLAKKQSAPKAETVSYETGYRTLCVRLCDGYYFPISSAASPEHFETDSLDCQSRCTSPSRLFVYKNAGGSPETMVDLDGRPYSELKTAFLHRTAHNPTCTCKADPWTEEAANKHRVYALEDASRKGDLDAATQLALMRSIVTRQVAEARLRSGAAQLKPVVESDIVPNPAPAGRNIAEAEPARLPVERATAAAEREALAATAASTNDDRPVVKSKRKQARAVAVTRKVRRPAPNDRYAYYARDYDYNRYAGYRYYSRYAAYRGW